MNSTVAETEAFFKSFKIKKNEKVELLICPPFTSIPICRFFLERSSIHWGAQNVYPEEKGAFTGEISPAMLKELGCTYVICGHSERRQILGESDAFVAQKVDAVLKAGLTPILCVGETMEERKDGPRRGPKKKSEALSPFWIRRIFPASSSLTNPSGPSAPAQRLRQKMQKRFLPSSAAS